MLSFSFPRLLVIFIIVALSCLLVAPTFFPEKFEGTTLQETKINLGLDLKGGSYLLLEVDSEQYNLDQMNMIIDDLELKLRKEGVRIKSFKLLGYNRIEYEIYGAVSGEKKKNYKKIINKIMSGFFNIHYKSYLDGLKGHTIVNKEFFVALQKNLLDQTLEIMRRRTDESGLKEIEIQKQGKKGILLQVPGISNPQLIKNIIGKTAKLSFHMVNNQYTTNDVLRGKIPKNLMVLQNLDGENYIIVERKEKITGDMLVDARATILEGMSRVIIDFNSTGAKKFATVTSENVGKQLAIVLDGQVISAPVIQDHIVSGRSSISGNFTPDSANELAMLLRAGALPAPLKVLEEQTIGPSLGQDSIEAGRSSMLLAVSLISICILLLYRTLGVFVLLGLVVNLTMILALLALTGASLTLSGIAGIILTLGIAVDANVLIIERIKEEYARTGQVIKSIINGFNNSFVTIVDANLTTVFTAVMLLLFGTGYVKGFAITLIFGIASSMFSAVMFTRFITALWYKLVRPKKLNL